MTGNCKECGRLPRERRSEFCSIKCRVDHNNRMTTAARPTRAICAVETCDRPVRTKRSLYCKVCVPKRKLTQPKPEPIQVPPGQYQCHWCDKPLRQHQVKVNALNEDYGDIRHGNVVASCRICFSRKQSAIFFMKHLNQDKFDLMMKLIPDCRTRRY